MSESKSSGGIKNFNLDYGLGVTISISVLTIAILVLDWQTQLGSADWLLYSIPLVISLSVPRLNPLILTTIITILIIAGFFLSAEGINLPIAIFNRSLGVFIMWALMVLLIHYKKLSQAVHTASIDKIAAELVIAEKELAFQNLEKEKRAAELVIADALALQNKKHVIALQKSHQELKIAKLAAEKANCAKSDFLSSMSHELRTPLNAILGFAQLLEISLPLPTAIQANRLNQITTAGWYLLELINEILDLAMIESGKVMLSLEPVSLLEIMLECQAMIETQAQQCDIKLNFIQCDDTWFIIADRTRTKQILINLLSNAIKYNSKQGTVEVKCTESGPERIRICIKDNGAGLSSEKLEQLFQPFNRLGQENGTEEGTGIGLVVTKQLVELMNGGIGVESTVGVGSEFWIELVRNMEPRSVVENTLLTKLTPKAQENVVQRTLLYVEDNPANLMLVEQIIEGHTNVNMLSAHEGNQGIALAYAYIPDVILMDINLPGLNGFQLLEILRKNPATMHIPIIALSANAMERDIEKGLHAGFFQYLTKPIKISEFKKTLDDALEFSATNLAIIAHPQKL